MTCDGRFLLLYLITNPHTHVSGIYYLPQASIIHETGLANRALDTLRYTLSEIGFCAFDRERELVWVKNMMRYQGRGEKNLRSAAHHLVEDLHESPLIGEFIQSYPEVKAFISDTVLDRLSKFGTPDSRSLIPDPDQDQEKKHAADDPRRVPFIDFCFQSYRAARGADLITDATDFKALKTLLKATAGKPLFVLEELTRYWQHFLDSGQEFHRTQGKPLRFFCLNINAFVRNGNGNGEGQDATRRAIDDALNGTGKGFELLDAIRQTRRVSGRT